VSEHLWWTQIHADPEIVGRSLTVDGRSFQVVGVTRGQADETGRADLYVPISHDPLFEQFKALRGAHSLVCIGRLADGITQPQALADLHGINQNLIGSVLYGVSATDPIALGISVLILGLAALLARMLPAVRPTRINPITALRDEQKQSITAYDAVKRSPTLCTADRKLQTANR
jgi:hypothetical protein